MSTATNNPVLLARSFAAASSRSDQEFRQWLLQRGFWSDNAERLFLYLTQNQQIPIPVTAQQKQLLEQMIEDALNGVNITERYPALFRDLLHNAALRYEFVNVANRIPQL
jgi:hypothetical protein